jgi:hypothetical protein
LYVFSIAINAEFGKKKIGLLQMTPRHAHRACVSSRTHPNMGCAAAIPIPFSLTGTLLHADALRSAVPLAFP